MKTDTIAALATPPGRGGVAVVRISGPDADRVLVAVAPAFAQRLPEARRPSLAEIVDPADGSIADHALVTRFPGPASYTGEDTVEISGHGGWTAPALVLEACRNAGSRMAEPGEFTRRAYLHGKMDLVQAEAVADLVGARSRAMHRSAVAQLDAGLSRRIGELRSGLVSLEAVLAHHIDFPEEDDAPTPTKAIAERASAVRSAIEGMLATAPEGQLLREGAVIVLAGAPNVGKSSLYNALVGEARALVTEVPGTTRDALECAVEIGGFPFRLMDTAGLRDTSDRVERLGIEVAERALEGADLVLLCGELGSGEVERGGVLPSQVPWIDVRTKADLVSERRDPVCARGDVGASEAAGQVCVSVRTGEGLGALRELIPRLVFGGVLQARDEGTVITRRRQADALRRAAAELARFEEMVCEGAPPEIAAVHLAAATEGLEDVVGRVDVEDMLDVLFSDFCVGK